MTIDPKMTGKTHLAAMDVADVTELNGHLASLFHTNIDAFHDEVHDWRYAEDVAANYFGVDLLHGWTGEGAWIPLNSEVISTRSSTPHHAIHDGIASTARGAGGAHHGVGNAPRPWAYGPRASTDTRGDLPPRRDKPAAAKGLRRAYPLWV